MAVIPGAITSIAILTGSNIVAVDGTTVTVDSEKYDPSNIVSLAANVMTLGAGKYFFDASWGSNHSAGGISYWHRMGVRLRNTSDSTTTFTSPSFSQTNYPNGGDPSDSYCRASGYFAITASKNYELQFVNFLSTAGTVTLTNLTVTIYLLP